VGDLKFDPLGLLKGKSAEEIIARKTQEINNGRLAMIGVAGIVVQELITQDSIF
jgi:light-harvesting complex I chlorophyll a/b binding protein 1